MSGIGKVMGGTGKNMSGIGKVMGGTGKNMSGYIKYVSIKKKVTSANTTPCPL